MRSACAILVVVLAAVASGCSVFYEDTTPPDGTSTPLRLPPPPAVPTPAPFSFVDASWDPVSTLSVFVQELDRTSGRVVVNGVDTTPAVEPFTFAWGDGSTAKGWFPLEHTYADLGRSYTVTVTALYGSGQRGTAEARVRFADPDLSLISFHDEVRVEIPSQPISLRSGFYSVPDDLKAFDDSNFTVTSRFAVEYVLSIAAWIQCEFANGGVCTNDGTFRQVVLRDADFAGMYSLWYTDPVAFAAADYAFRGDPQYSSFFHEMGHNVALNTPANFRFGGKIDGRANAIYSETMAQIFQHATAFEIINNAETYGLWDALRDDIIDNAMAIYDGAGDTYRSYVSRGCPFDSWNDPAPDDDANVFDTFVTISFVFCQHAEQAGGFREPLKRMMRLLQTFDESMQVKYSQFANSPDAETFRATLMVAAMSYAFTTDLRSEFRSLGFPISDEEYDTLIAQARSSY